MRFILRVLTFLASALIGLLVATLLLPAMTLHLAGLIVAIVVFALAQSIVTPLLKRIADRNLPDYVGLVGLASTYVGLVVASLFPGGLVISGWRTWVLCTIVTWAITALAAQVLRAIPVSNTEGATQE